MNKIQEAFSDGPAFIPFITAGDPDLETTEQLLYTLQAAGADIIEIGIPFSDPIAEGPIIEAADVRALEAGFTVDKLFELIGRLRADIEVPLLLMTYYNPIFVYGIERFCGACAACGIDGLIVPDLPFEERDELRGPCAGYGMELISLIAPTSEERVDKIAQASSGFLYCVSSLGVTGERRELGTTAAQDMIARVRTVSDIPCAVGFGVSTPEQAAEVVSFADGVIIGSAFERIIAEKGRDAPAAVAQFAREIKAAITGQTPTPSPTMYKDILAKITTHQELCEREVSELITGIREGTVSDVQIAGFQVALLMKGASLPEIAYIAKAMRDNCVPLRPKVSAEMMDTCGTGGGLSTFNISTATALVAAAAGIPIAKHGSRSIASLSGSADVLEALGVNIELEPRQVERMIEEIGIAFLYAPLFHPVMGKVLPPEQDLGIKTIFYSIIGPLINPAFAPRHLLGVYKPDLLDTVTYVAKELGYTNAMFVHGLDGLDEISLLGKTRVNHLKDGEVTTFEIEPEDFGLQRCCLEDIKTGTPEVNAETIRGVLSGEVTGPRRDAIVLNAAGALVIGGKADDFSAGIDLAGELIDSGQAARKLEELVTMSNSFEKVA